MLGEDGVSLGKREGSVHHCPTASCGGSCMSPSRQHCQTEEEAQGGRAWDTIYHIGDSGQSSGKREAICDGTSISLASPPRQRCPAPIFPFIEGGSQSCTSQNAFHMLINSQNIGEGVKGLLSAYGDARFNRVKEEFIV